MKLGIVADEIDRDFGEAVRIGLRLDLRRYEVRFLKSGRAPRCDLSEMQEVERIAAREEVEITALSPGLFKYTEDKAAFEREMAEVYPRAAEWAHRWKLPGLLVFGFRKPGATEENPGPMFRREWPNSVLEWFSRAGERAEADGLLLMIEPEPICWADTAATVADLIRRTGARSLRINYDPGNVAWLLQRDPLDEFGQAAPWIANVHVKDLRHVEPGRARPEFVPAGEGIIDYSAHFEALRRMGYEGPISLEPHMDGREETIRRCQEAFGRMWNRA